jgi:hypothetical protein
MFLRYLLIITALALSGCSVLPEVAHQPTLHNPFPQLSKVAVAPFVNLSDESTLDGRQFGLAYFNELQSVPGFEVIPLNVVEAAMLQHRIDLSSPEEARHLAQLLGADAVVLGAVTDYSPYYPPRLTMRVEWYSANECFHPIPPGYGLPWGTPAEEHIPGQLVFEAELALAKEQLNTQTPAPVSKPHTPLAEPTEESSARIAPLPEPTELINPQPQGMDRIIDQISYDQAVAAPTVSAIAMDSKTIEGFQESPDSAGLPPNWPDESGFVSPPPRKYPAACRPTTAPVMQHTQAYNGNDTEFTEALASYYFFRDDARFGGWQSYLQRSDDFIRFCCHMHIWERLSARGGAGETRVVWRWPEFR